VVSVVSCSHCKSSMVEGQWTNYIIFTVLHGMQMRSIDENSVCLSIKCGICDKMEERFVQIFTPYERLFSLVF